MALMARGALDAVMRPGRSGRPEGEAGVSIAVLPARAQAIVLAHRGQARILVDACATRGLVLPTLRHAQIGRDLTIVAMGPGQWLALGEPAAGDPAGALFAPLASACTLVRADDARTLLEVSGPAARKTLAKLLTIDLHPRVFSPGDAAATLAATIAVMLWQIDEAPRFRLAVPRGFAASFHHWLAESGAEYGVATLDAAAP